MWFWYGVTRKSQNIIGKSSRLSGTMYNYISDAENIVNQSFGKADVWYTWISFLWCWWGLLGSEMPTNGSSPKKENSRNTVKLKMVRSEGGRQWLVCAFAFLAQFAVVGFMMTGGVLYTKLIDAFKASRGATGMKEVCVSQVRYNWLTFRTTSELIQCRIMYKWSIKPFKNERLAFKAFSWREATWREKVTVLVKRSKTCNPANWL